MNDLVVIKQKEIVIFHGGCNGCTRQHTEPEGTKYCMGCQYFDADWGLPDLSNVPPDTGDLERERLMRLYT